MDRIAQKTAGSYALSVPTTDDDGLAVAATAPATVVVTDATGATVHTGTATVADRALTASVPTADMDELGRYTATWTDDADLQWVSHVEVCGGFFFDLPAMREIDPAFADSGRHTAEKLRQARIWAEDRFEVAAGVAFVPRANRVVVYGDGTSRIHLPHVAIRRLRSVSVAGTAMTLTELGTLVVREWGAVDKPSGATWTDGSEIEVVYEHGLDFPPEPVVNATKILVPEYLTRKALSSRALTEVNDLGTFNLSVAGRRRPTGIPEVDRVAQDFGRDTPRIF